MHLAYTAYTYVKQWLIHVSIAEWLLSENLFWIEVGKKKEICANTEIKYHNIDPTTCVYKLH